MFLDALPRHTHARTRARLERNGVTWAVLFLNALEWVTLSMHRSLGRILVAALAIALASRYELTAIQYLLLIPMSYLLVIDPLLRAASTMHRQLELHEQAVRVWAKAQADVTPRN